MPTQTVLDAVASDLAVWLDQTATKIAAAMAPQGVAPFSAPLSEGDKLEFYRAQLFNPDGTPNVDGRAQQVQRLGPLGFTQVYKAVIKAYPELRIPAPPEGAAPPPGTPPMPAPVPMAGGGIVTQPTLALIGEAGPEAVVPLAGYQYQGSGVDESNPGWNSGPPPTTGELTDPNIRAQLLRDSGWTEDAIRKATGLQTTISQQPEQRMGVTQGPSVFGLSVPVGDPNITLYEPSIQRSVGAGTGPSPEANLGVATTPADVYEHEAHHAMDFMNPLVGANSLYNHGQDAATVLNDLNMLRQYAAVQHNAQLYDAANAAMSATSNDPIHVNHYLAYASGLEGAPDWYLAKYFPFIKEAPSWPGAQARSAPLQVTSPRLQGG